MKKVTGRIIVLMLILCIVTMGCLIYLLWQKNSEMEDLRSDLRRKDKDIKEYETEMEQMETDADALKKEKDKLTQDNKELKEQYELAFVELEGVKAELQEKEEHTPSDANVIFDDVGRVYQQGEYAEFCNQNDTYDTRQYTFSTMYNFPTDVVFVGDSLVERGAWSEMYPELEVKNRGIGGDSINGVRVRISTVMLTKPKKVFIYVGINDILNGREVNNIIGRYNELFDVLSAYDCKIYMQSILPVSASQNGSEMINPDVEEINNRLMGICESRGITYINLWEQFKDDDGALRDEFYYDGVHINSTAYKRWKELIDQYVYE